MFTTSYKYRIGFGRSDKSSQKLSPKELTNLCANRNCESVKFNSNKHRRLQGSTNLILPRISNNLSKARVSHSNQTEPLATIFILISLLSAFALLTSHCQVDSTPAEAQSDNELELHESFINPEELDTFRAIKTLHTKLDVDADGEVDDFESQRFLESGKIIENSGNNKNMAQMNAHKLRYLHQDGKDRSISVNELWNAWKNSPVHNWTIDETIFWLVYHVELPEYSELFIQRSINGSYLPRLAADSQFVYKLGIADSSAKKKISIKAMDVVLFGPPKTGNPSKLRDIIVGIVTFLAIFSCIFFYKRNIASQRALLEQQKQYEFLQRAVDQLPELQSELDKALKDREVVKTEKKNLEHQLEMQRQFSASSSLSELSKPSATGSGKQMTNGDILQQQEAAYVSKLELEVKDLRKELEETRRAKDFRAPYVLRSLLRATYDVESQYYKEKKLFLEVKARELKERSQKLQKKKASFLGYYKMAQENSIEEDTNAIIEVKNAILQVTKEIKQGADRWREIESLCGCHLDLNPTLLRV